MNVTSPEGKIKGKIQNSLEFPNLTEKQQQVFIFIYTSLLSQHRFPKYRDIQSHLHLKAISTAYKYVQYLEQKGLVVRTAFGKRQLTEEGLQLGGHLLKQDLLQSEIEALQKRLTDVEARVSALEVLASTPKA